MKHLSWCGVIHQSYTFGEGKVTCSAKKYSVFVLDLTLPLSLGNDCDEKFCNELSFQIHETARL
jgi:hypothetical protein